MTEPMLIAPLPRLEAANGAVATGPAAAPIKSVKAARIYGLPSRDIDLQEEQPSPSVRKFQKSGPRARYGPHTAAAAVASSKAKIRSKGNNINNMAINNKSAAIVNGGTAATTAMKHRLEL